ncbi:hypothetical protein LV779_07920 [Streptomyces thinghirensis]|nr:hypothetical protein [Streptomyces thinghirensis]
MILRTDAGDGLEGHAFTFTIGRGNDVQAAATAALRDHVLGPSAEAVCADPGSVGRALTGDSQLRWLGPGEGRDAHGDRRRRQRGVGPGGQAGGQTGVEAALRRRTGMARGPGGLPLHRGRPHP